MIECGILGTEGSDDGRPGCNHKICDLTFVLTNHFCLYPIWQRSIFYFPWGSKWERVSRGVVKRLKTKGGKGIEALNGGKYNHNLSNNVYVIFFSLSTKLSSTLYSQLKSIAD